LVKEVSNIKETRHGDVVSFQAYLSKMEEVRRVTKKGERTFYECNVSDDSGTIEGSLYKRSSIYENRYCDLVKVTVEVSLEGKHRIIEVVPSEIYPNDRLNFKLVDELIE
jgi:hypothetical protein